jgi:hypothetical protein
MGVLLSNHCAKSSYESDAQSVVVPAHAYVRIYNELSYGTYHRSIET